MLFLESKLWCFNLIFTEVCSWGSKWLYVPICSSNGLGPNRWQNITWISGYPDPWRHIEYLDHNELNFLVQIRLMSHGYFWLSFCFSPHATITLVRKNLLWWRWLPWSRGCSCSCCAWSLSSWMPYDEICMPSYRTLCRSSYENPSGNQ